ncbi:hypothetical protein Sjap_021761 [Stephania japonica]|uniref:Uncharacterized protein n=1 Tax=Stephania japonica TaxID=461633 RepID=A0AAP0EWD7_9MAGN
MKFGMFPPNKLWDKTSVTNGDENELGNSSSSRIPMNLFPSRCISCKEGKLNRDDGIDPLS